MKKANTVLTGSLLVLSTCSVALADPASDAKYCAALGDLYSKYVNANAVEAHDQPGTSKVAMAIGDCATGAASSIPLLEEALKGAGVTLPPSGGYVAAAAAAAAAPAQARPTSGPLKAETRLLANKGDAAAQYDLGLRYQAGEGVPQDYALAHMWFNLSAASLAPISEKAAAARNALQRTQMTPAQVAEAQRLAREWKPAK
jgi:TPR repeat protein